MAFGSINIRLLQEIPQEKKEKPEKKKVNLATSKKDEPKEKDFKKETPFKEEINVNYTPTDGVDDLTIAIIAADEVQAKDYLCSLYCNLVSMTQASELSFYTRQHHTITMLTETKQYLERTIMKPSGSKVKSTNNEVYSEYTLILGQTANQKMSLNLHFVCTSYASVAKAGSADITIIIINSADSEITAEKLAGVRNSLRGKAVAWVMTGFARENTFYSSELDVPPSSTVTKKLKERFSPCFGNGDTFCYAQQYGGLVIEEHEGSIPVYTTLSECREYTPVACGLPLAYSLAEFRKNCDESRFAVHRICDKLISILKTGNEISSGWHEKFNTTEG